MEIKNEQDLLEIMKRLIVKITPDATRESSTNIRSGFIQSVNTTNRTASVKLMSNGQILVDVTYSKGMTSLQVGDRCLLLSPDASTTSLNLIVGVF